MASLKDNVDIVHSLVTCIAIVVGGIWGVSEYLEKKSQDRIGKSFEIVAKFRENEELRKYGEFEDSDDVIAILNDRNLSASEKSDRIVGLHSAEHRRQLMRLIDAYENAVTCVTANHCDKNVIATFMARDAHSAYVIGYGVIKKTAALRNDQNYGQELRVVREWYCALPDSGNGLKVASWCPPKN